MRVYLVDDIAVALVARDGDPRRISLTCFSPANVGFSEPHLENLLLSSFREVPPWPGHALPMERELTLDRPSPPLTMPSGNTVEPRRTFLHDAETRHPRVGEPAGALHPMACNGTSTCMAAARAGGRRWATLVACSS
jgi:hypothetical protein